MRLRTPSDYRREIAATEAMINAELELGQLDPASELTVRNLRRRREELEEELNTLGDEGISAQELDIVLSGRPVLQNAVETEFLAEVLERMQKLVRATANAVAGRRGRSGPIPREIAKQSTLRLSSTFAGSFGMRLEAISDDPQIEAPGLNTIAPAFDALLGLFQAPADDPQLLEVLGRVGPRATSEYRKFLQHLGKKRAGVIVTWPGVSTVREGVIDSRAAARLARRLDQVSHRQFGREYAGELYLADKKHLRFGFTDAAGNDYSGNISADLLQDVLDYLQEKACRAYIVTTEVRDRATGDIRRTHQLQELLPAEQ